MYTYYMRTVTYYLRTVYLLYEDCTHTKLGLYTYYMRTVIIFYEECTLLYEVSTRIT